MRSLLMISVLAFAVPDRPDPTPKRANPLKEQLQGEWRVVESSYNGGQHPGIGPGVVIVFKDDRMILHLQPGDAGAIFAIRLDETKNPTAFDFSYGTGKSGWNPTIGIFKIEGDTLTICYHNNVRPSQFAAAPNSGLSLWKMKRTRR